jgi:hypothetical protein
MRLRRTSPWNGEEQNIEINLTKKQIEGSPSLDSDKPVSRPPCPLSFPLYRL